MSNLINIVEQTTFQIKACYSEIVIKRTFGGIVEEIEAFGLSILPQWLDHKPTSFRTQIITKSQSGLSEEQLYNALLEGKYYLNISDYSDNELRIAFDLLVRKWADDIWSSLMKADENYTITLKEHAIIRQIVEKNKDLFTCEKDFKNFCAINGLAVDNFIIPGKFSYLDIKLKEIDLRLQMEQFYARRFLLTNSLIINLESRLRDFSLEVPEKNRDVLKYWIEDIKKKNTTFQNYKDFQKLYDMPKQEIKIENNENVNFFNGDVSHSDVSVANSSRETKPDSFDKRTKIIGILFAGISILLTTIIYWEEIVLFFEK